MLKSMLSLSLSQVLIEPAIEEKKEKDKGKGKDEKKEKEAAVVGGISARKERMRARMAG